MNIKQSSKQAALLLIFTGGFAGSGQAQNDVSPSRVTQKTAPQGVVRLEQSKATQRHVGPVYTLSLVEIADAKPAASVWFLQKEVVQQNEPIEVHENAFRSLAALSLRDLVSHLPAGARICCTNRYLPGPDPVARVGINNAAGLQDFAAFCRSKGVEFIFGIPF